MKEVTLQNYVMLEKAFRSMRLTSNSQTLSAHRCHHDQSIFLVWSIV